MGAEEGYDSPEEAARGDIPAQFFTVLGVRIDGDEGCVWSLTNDRPTFEAYEDVVVRRGSKWFWEGGSGGLGLTAPREIVEKAARLGYPV